MKKFLIKTLIIFFIVIIIFNNTYAANIVITEEALQNSFKKLAEYSNSSNNNLSIDDTATMNIDKDNKTIKLSSGGENYIINYDLSDKPTFSIDLLFTSDMIDSEWMEESEKTTMLIVPFVLVSDIAGVDPSDSLIYMLSVLFDHSNSSFSFIPSNALEYAEFLYDETSVIEDTLFTWTTQKVSETSTEYKVKSTLVINNNADFSVVINDHLDSVTKSIADSFYNSINTIMSSNLIDYAANASNVAGSTTVRSNLSSINKLPQTGRALTLKDSLYALIFLSFIGIVVLLFADYRYKNINKK